MQTRGRHALPKVWGPILHLPQPPSLQLPSPPCSVISPSVTVSGFLSHLPVILPATSPSAFLLLTSLQQLRYSPPQTFRHLSVRHLLITFSPRTVTSSHWSPVTFSSSATLLLSPQCLPLSCQPPSRLLSLIQPFSCHLPPFVTLPCLLLGHLPVTSSLITPY